MNRALKTSLLATSLASIIVAAGCNRSSAAGAVDPLARLDAERTARAAERDALSARTERHLALVGLYKALGGT